jgi:hypothetical protein
MVWLIFGFKIYGYFRMVTGMVMDLLLKPVILHRPNDLLAFINLQEKIKHDVNS